MKNKNVLIVDDDVDILNLLRESLEDLSINVLAYSSSVSALKEVDFSKVDCIVSDILMPELDGIQFMNQVEARGYQIPLFFITGYSEYPREVLNAFKPKAIVFKPFDAEELAILVKNHILRS